MNKEKRISILLDKQTYNCLESHAKKIGIAKSKLIREWIMNTNKVNTLGNEESNKKNINYNFRLADEAFNKLLEIVANSKLSTSEVIRALVLKYTNEKIDLTNIFSVNSGEINEVKIKDLWLKGELSDIYHSNESNTDLLSVEDLITFVRASTELGNLDNSLNAIDILNWKARKLDSATKLKINVIAKLLKVDVNIYKRDTKWFQRDLEQIEELKYFKNERGMIGINNLQLGENAIYHENFGQAIQYYEKALDLLDIQNYPTLMIRGYIRLAKAHLHKLNKFTAKRYLDKAFELSKGLNNKFYIAWVYADQSLFELTNGNLVEAENKVIKAVNLTKKIEGQKSLCYALDHYGRISMFKGDEEKAYSLFSKAESLEKKFRPENAFSHARTYRLFIESKRNLPGAINKLKDHSRKTTGSFFPSFGKYFLSVAQLLNKDEEMSEGQSGLKELAETTNNVQIKYAAIKTLETGEVGVIR